MPKKRACKASIISLAAKSKPMKRKKPNVIHTEDNIESEFESSVASDECIADIESDEISLQQQIDALSAEVKQQGDIIFKLTAQLSFVLSFIGVSDDDSLLTIKNQQSSTMSSDGLKPDGRPKLTKYNVPSSYAGVVAATAAAAANVGAVAANGVATDAQPQKQSLHQMSSPQESMLAA